MDQPTEPTYTHGEQSKWILFGLLLWKNWLIQKNKKIRTVLMLLLPIILSLSLVGPRSASHIVRVIPYPPFLIPTNLGEVLKDPPEKLILAYVPNTTLVERIVTRTAALMNVTISTDLGFESEDALAEYATMGGDLFGAIVFISDKWVELPKKMRYKIRLRSGKLELKSHKRVKIEWKTNVMFSGQDGPVIGNVKAKGPVYREEGFLAIQKAVDLSLIAEVNQSFEPTTTNVTIQLKQYPFNPYTADDQLTTHRIYLHLVLLFSFIITVPTICQEIALERENKFKVFIKLMGMRMWLYWSSWFVKYLLFMLTSVLFMTLLLHAPISPIGPVIAHCSATVIFVFLLLYTLSIVTFCFAISALTSKASFSAAIGLTFYILSDTPHYHLMLNYDDLTVWKKFLSSLDFNVAMGFGCLEIAQYEYLGNGMHWNTIWSSEDDFTMGHILLMLLVDIIIYSMFTWYLDAVIPGEFGTPQPFYFPFTREFWMGREEQMVKLRYPDFMRLIPEDKRPYFETPLQNANPRIQIRGLTKDFGSKTNPAVNNISIDIYEGNITALLGHNGAGKTTIMLVLAGFMPPSKGTAFINDLDITRYMDKIRPSIGLCQQDDVFYDTLTVREYLFFSAVLKGSTFKTASMEMNEMVRVLQMEEKLNSQTKTLSGGQRRKLSVGIALITGSKLLILDEPTSGMDPESRRQFWDILQSQRKDRTIILSTHYMDEADILGDRIAIMAKGEIQCYGTPMFLKKKYGVGYSLTVEKTPSCDVDQLRDAIKHQIPKALKLHDEAEEVMFLLPSNQSSKFEGLFDTLETESKTFGIHSFGVSYTTMEEVFLNVMDSSSPEKVNRTSLASGAEIQGNISRIDVLYRKERGWKSQNLQLRATFYKRLVHSMRNYPIALGQMFFPAIFVLNACLNILGQSRSDADVKLTLDLTHFDNPITPYEVRPLQPANAQKLGSCYKATALRRSTPIFINSDSSNLTMDEFLVRIGKYHKAEYNRNYMIAATIEYDPVGGLTITGLFNNKSYHTIAISLSYLGNTLMQYFGDNEYQIETVNHPLPINQPSSSYSWQELTGTANKAFIFSSFVSTGLSILFATFLIFLIKERKSGAKHMQLVSGVRLHNFWLATFLWDYINYLVSCILIIVIILCFHVEVHWQTSWITFIGLMLYGFSMLPIVYVVSFLFEEESVGFVWLSLICIVTGTIMSSIITILELLPFRSALSTVEWVFYVISPACCFIAILQNTYINYSGHKDCSEINQAVKLTDFCAHVKQLGQSNPCCADNCGQFCKIVDNYFSLSWPGIGRPMVCLVLQGIVFLFILYIIESDIIGLLHKVTAPNRVSQAMLTEMDADEEGKISEDSDVANERQRIHSNPIGELVQTNPVVTQDLTKLYGDFVAVNQLSIGVFQRECFGLLGVNGAGKTTVFKMLTGEILPSAGGAYIAGISVQDDIAEVRQKIGYCPQFDSIIDQMTVRETLWMHACAHGIPDKVREEVIDRLIDHLTLEPYMNMQAGNLSGGNKRKLCVAVALMGNPTVVFLDEPTTGVDPEARRHVWNTLAAARRAGTTIILTSHSMEECESICTRMGILVNGRFLCLGSLQHLRNKFSDGYTLTIKLKRSPDTENPEEQTEKLKTFISQTFPESVLKDHHENRLYYQVETPTFKWSEIFGIMEKAKLTYDIEDYSVGQTTLEQIFIGFARRQRGPRIIYTNRCLGLC